jgi:Kef-type K+ transport system membrane component KefB
MNNKRLLYMLAAVPVVLLIPMFGSIFTDQVDWDLADFIIMGIMLSAVALGIEFTLRKVKTTKNRIILGACIFVLFALVWGELAVGLFGSPFAGN